MVAEQATEARFQGSVSVVEGGWSRGTAWNKGSSVEGNDKRLGAGESFAPLISSYV